MDLYRHYVEKEYSKGFEGLNYRVYLALWDSDSIQKYPDGRLICEAIYNYISEQETFVFQMQDDGKILQIMTGKQVGVCIVGEDKLTVPIEKLAIVIDKYKDPWERLKELCFYAYEMLLPFDSQYPNMIKALYMSYGSPHVLLPSKYFKGNIKYEVDHTVDLIEEKPSIAPIDDSCFENKNKLDWDPPRYERCEQLELFQETSK